MVERVSMDATERSMYLKGRLSEIITEARMDLGDIDDPKAQALFETTAEVLAGLVTAFDHYKGRSEPAWQ